MSSKEDGLSDLHTRRLPSTRGHVLTMRIPMQGIAKIVAKWKDAADTWQRVPQNTQLSRIQALPETMFMRDIAGMRLNQC